MTPRPLIAYIFAGKVRHLAAALAHAHVTAQLEAARASLRGAA